MTRKSKETPVRCVEAIDAKGEDTGDERSFDLGRDGMGTGTARIAIDRRLRQKIMEEYDLLGLENKGRYYAARACSKDGRWLFELLIDKQTGNIHIASQKEARR